MSASKGGHADTATDNPEAREVTISVEELMRTRTQLVTGLTNISSAINEFVRSYVHHTNKWIGTETVLPAGLDIAAMSNLFATNVNSVDPFLSAAAPAGTPGKRGPYKKGEKKKRKEKDPNAPKRPLTAFFLYSQSARSIVKQDYEQSGHTPSASEVSEEILRRWKNMGTEEQAPWKELYEKNADAYRKDMDAYKATTGAAAAEEHDAAAATAGAVDGSDADAAGEVATEAAPAKGAKAAKGKGKKKDAATAAGATQERDSPSAQLISRSTVPLPGSQPEPAAAAPPTKAGKRKSEAADPAKAEEPPKKRKRKSKAEKDAEEAAAKETAKAAAPAAEAAPEKKKKSKAKKDKSSD